MKSDHLTIYWPNKVLTKAKEGEDWFDIAQKANINIPSGCMLGSCGACEIDVNGETIRPCIKNIESKNTKKLMIEFTTDPFW